MSTNDNISKGTESKKANESQNFSSEKGGNKKMEIEITRYKGLVNAFNTPTALAKLIIVISLIIVLVFFGISVIALVVKSYYPYKAVNSNEYGATIIENEDNEVIYWLFNTADLWANSGIRVKEGDVISVRASGAFNSSIHHLVEEASENKKGRNWLSPMGGPNSSGPREKPRAQFRISPAHTFNTLLMQVIPEDVELKDNEGNWNTEYSCYLDGKPKEVRNNNNTLDYNRSIFPDIYAIGSERDKITIRSDGVLYFAVNDIAMTRRVIMQMKDKMDWKLCKEDGEYKNKYVDSSLLRIGAFPIPDVSDTNRYKRDSIGLIKGLDMLGNDKKMNSSDFYYLFSDDIRDNNIYNMSYRSKYMELYDKLKSIKTRSMTYEDTMFFGKNYSELDYYLIRNFVDAWFVDNAGSYLIVIERKKQ